MWVCIPLSCELPRGGISPAFPTCARMPHTRTSTSICPTAPLLLPGTSIQALCACSQRGCPLVISKRPSQPAPGPRHPASSPGCPVHPAHLACLSDSRNGCSFITMSLVPCPQETCDASCRRNNPLDGNCSTLLHRLECQSYKTTQFLH